MSPERGLFRKLDNHLLRVADLDAAISFYRDKLGHRLLWRSGEAAGFALPETDAELVVHLKIGPETDIVVADVDKAFALFLSAGGAGSRVRSTSRSAGARAFATRSAMNSSCWINRKADWRPTPMGE